MFFQLENALKIAKIMFPNKKRVWVFDNSSGHSCKAADALMISKMNVGPGGKNITHMHSTVIPDDNPHGYAGELQFMQFDNLLPAGHVYQRYQGQPKGIRVILEEHGYITIINPESECPKARDMNGKTLIGECKACKEFKS